MSISCKDLLEAVGCWQSFATMQELNAFTREPHLLSQFVAAFLHGFEAAILRIILDKMLNFFFFICRTNRDCKKVTHFVITVTFQH